MRDKIGRKITRFYICRYHEHWFYTASRRRTAEAFDEGGPGTAPACDLAHPCRIWPGTDFFVPSVCNTEADWPKTWAVNRKV